MGEQAYSPSHVREVLRACGLKVVAETGKTYCTYCPFHGNRDTHAFNVSKQSGAFNCHNPTCGRSGTLNQLVRVLTGRNQHEALRLIAKHETAEPVAIEEPFEWEEWPQERIDRLHAALWDSPGQEYMHGRGFNDETLAFFQIGWSEQRQMVTVPVHNHEGMLVGMVARSVEGKRFKLTAGIPKNLLLFNLNRAKQYDNVIVVEASFDAMRLHQAGYPNVVAMLGSNVSEEHLRLLNRYFIELTSFTDNDDAGRAIRSKIAEGYERPMYFAGSLEGYKDPGEMQDEQIRLCLDERESALDIALQMC